MEDKKQIIDFRFQNFWLAFMFVFLWMYVIFIRAFLIPTHRKMMSVFGLASWGLFKSAVFLFYPILTGTLLCLLLLGLSKISFKKEQAAGKRKLRWDSTPSLWRKAAVSVLMLAVLYLVVGLSVGWLEGVFHFPAYIGKKIFN